MKNKKLPYVKRDFINKIDAEYIVIIGQRANGKSFAVKEDVIKRALENGEEFAYIRRYKEDCKQYMVTEYFSDIICDKNGVNHILEWSDGKYNDIVCREQSIYFAFTDEDGKTTKGQKLGRMFGLSWATHYKSLSFPNMTTAVYEEFVTDGEFLSDEVRRFMNLISTIFRERKARVYLVGNTISRINPFFNEWELVNIPKQKVNSIEVYRHKYRDENDNEHETRIAVYLTHSTKINSGMFFGNIGKSIVSTMWETDEHPHLKGRRDEYETLYTMVFIYDKTLFLMELLKNSKNYVWFVSPKNTPPQKNTRIISNKFIQSDLYTNDFTPIVDGERLPFKWIKERKICFSDNLTGTEFFQCYNML